MTLIEYIVFLAVIICTNTYVTGEIAPRPKWEQFLDRANNYITPIKPPAIEDDKVNIQLYYEAFCGDCRIFDITEFKRVVLQLYEYLNIKTYPYGNAQTVDHNGKYIFKCQHGPKECYGNKLHACTLDIIQDHYKALLYNSCLMEASQKNRGSDDGAADKCGAFMEINSEPIKACAKSEKGNKLLKYYGDESKKANFDYVPYVLINGKVNNGSNFMKDVCAAFANPPLPCTG